MKPGQLIIIVKLVKHNRFSLWGETLPDIIKLGITIFTVKNLQYFFPTMLFVCFIEVNGKRRKKSASNAPLLLDQWPSP